MSPPQEKLRACDVLNWNYLVKIAKQSEGSTNHLAEALAGFSYDFTSTADENVRDQMLAEFLLNATANESKKSAEDVVACLAKYLESDAQKLRQFAKENGVRLKRG